MNSKKTLFTITFLCILKLSQAQQAGIGTQVPKVTFDVTGSATKADVTDGVLVPRLTGNQLAAKNAVYLEDQNGALVYVTASASNPSGKTLNVTSVGFYYYDHAATVWKPLGNNIYNTNGALTENRTVTQGANSLSFSSANNTSNASTRFINTSRTASAHKPALQIQDGSQGVGKVLLSDASGNARWASVSELPIKRIEGVMADHQASIHNITIPAAGTSDNFRNLRSYIDLPPGTWEVESNITIDMNGANNYDIAGLNHFFIKFSFGNDPTSSSNANNLQTTASATNPYFIGAFLFANSTTTVPGTGGTSGQPQFSIINGKLTVVNPSTTTKRIYLILRQVVRRHSPVTINSNTSTAGDALIKGLGTSVNGENYIRATRLEF